MGVSVGVAVFVGVDVNVGSVVGVGVSVSVGSGVDVSVEVGAIVAVNVAVGVGLCPLQPISKVANIKKVKRNCTVFTFMFSLHRISLEMLTLLTILKLYRRIKKRLSFR
jgi:hypothetical protein